MNRSVALAGLLALLLASPSFAAEPDSSAAQSVRPNPAARSNTTENVPAPPGPQSGGSPKTELQVLQAQCEQDARTYALQGTARDQFLAVCMSRGAASSHSHGTPWGGPLILGLGIGFPDLQDVNPGWELVLGIQHAPANGWQTGADFHILSSNNFQMEGLYATASPQFDSAYSVQFQGGLVYAHHDVDVLPPQDRWSGAGPALGVGLLFGGSTAKVHILDLRTGRVAGHGFAVVSVNVFVLVYAVLHVL